MKVKNIKFVVILNGNSIGEIVRAKDINELLEDKMLKRHKKAWMVIKWRDDEGRTISLSKYHLEEGMSVDEVIEDHIEYGDTEETITSLNPNGSGTIQI